MEKIEKIVVSRTSRKNVMVFGIKSPFDIEILSCTNEDISVYMRSNISMKFQGKGNLSALKLEMCKRSITILFLFLKTIIFFLISASQFWATKVYQG
jgi:hypothetical protein